MSATPTVAARLGRRRATRPRREAVAFDRPRFLYVATAFALLLVAAPLVVVVLYSFNSSRSLANFTGFSTRWYSTALHDSDLRASLGTSVEIAVIVTVLSGSIGSALARGVARGHRLRAAPTQGAVILRLLAPETAIAVALLLMFSQLHVELSKWTIIGGHVALCVPFVAVIVGARLASINPEIEDAAMDLGATRLGALRLEVLPLLWPALAGASVLTFVISFDNFITSFFTAGVHDSPLPLRIYSMLRFGVTPVVNALGVLMTVITVAGAALAALLFRMARNRQGPTGG